MFHRSATTHLFLRLLKNAQFGTVVLSLPDGRTEYCGGGAPVIHAQVLNWRVFDLLFHRGDIGLAEAVMNGELVVDDMVALVEWACRNDQSLSEALHGRWYGTLVHQLKKFLQLNNRRGAKKNIMAHYDAGNDFYRLWLDPSMTYSSAYFEAGAASLEAAQYAKYDRLIDELGIKAGDRVLEIGAGWGGFFSRAVEKTGCHVTAVLNSPSQAKYNRKLIQTRGFESHVDLREIDYRDIEGKFDKVVSIEMIEAVGERYWNQFFAKVSESLKEKGTAMIQAITIREDLFSAYRKQTDFIQQYIFPGGMLLTEAAITREGAGQGLRLGENHTFALSYAETLKRWREKFRASATELRSLGFDQKFVTLWDLYLSYCEGAFRAGRTDVGQFLLQK